MFSNFAIFIFFYIFILFSVVGYGLIISKLDNRNYISNNLGYLGLIGLFFLGIYSYLSSIFLKHNYLHNSLVLLIGFASFLYFIKINFNKYKTYILRFLTIFFIVFISSLIYKMHDDFPYYHFPYSYILTQNNLIIGLGQLNLGFRTPSSLFYLNSIFYLPLIKFYIFMMPAILILGFVNLIIYEKIIKNFKNKKINYITYFCLLILIFINIFFYRIGEHGTDKSAQILIFLLIIEILIFLEIKKFSPKILSKTYLLIGLIISLKAFYVLYAATIVVLFFKVIKKKKYFQSMSFFLKNSFFIPLFIFFILILFSYFTNTGCLVYPVSFTCFENFSWSISKKEVIELNNWYELWSKAGAGPNHRVENPLIYINNFNWIGNWIDKYFFNKVSDFLLGVIFLIFFVTFFFYSSEKRNLKFPKIKFLITLLFLLFIEWFYNHPALRYGGYSAIISICFLFFSISLGKYKLPFKRLKKRFNILILITIIIFLGRNINRIQNEIEVYSYNPIFDVNYRVEDSYFNISNLINNKISNYNLCELKKIDCKELDNIQIKKIYNYYVLYKDDQ